MNRKDPYFSFGQKGRFLRLALFCAFLCLTGTNAYPRDFYPTQIHLDTLGTFMNQQEIINQGQNLFELTEMRPTPVINSRPQNQEENKIDFFDKFDAYYGSYRKAIEKLENRTLWFEKPHVSFNLHGWLFHRAFSARDLITYYLDRPMSDLKEMNKIIEESLDDLETPLIILQSVLNDEIETDIKETVDFTSDNEIKGDYTANSRMLVGRYVLYQLYVESDRAEEKRKALEGVLDNAEESFRGMKEVVQEFKRSFENKNNPRNNGSSQTQKILKSA